MKPLAPLLLALLLAPVEGGALTLAFWDFNSNPADGNANTGTLTPALGAGTASLIGGVTASFTASNGSSDPRADNSNWRITTWPAQGTGNKSHGVQFAVNTAGARDIRVRWDQRNSNTASRYTRLQYTTNGTDFIDYAVITMPAESWVNNQQVSFASVPGVDDNPLFGIRFVIEFESTATGTGANAYVASDPASSYGNVGTLRFDMLEVAAGPVETVSTFSLLTYNIFGGNFPDTAEDWSTNSPQLRAAGEVLRYLKPDVVAFQEISVSNTWQMTNFLNVYLPGYALAANSTTAGGLRNVTASRFPIARSQSWLARTDLNPFGFDGVFTRDLFETEINVPGLPQPLHVFNVHLKAFNDEISAPRRAAEARCISNWFVTIYLTGADRNEPYALLGDMNEDIFRPRSYEQDAIGTLISAPTGLKLISPLNPVTGSERTWSSTNATIRFDYVIPCAFLFSNYAVGLVFRSEVSDATHPPPVGLPTYSTQAASDHLPVMLAFNNPFAPFSITSCSVTNDSIGLRWQSQVNARYRVEFSTDFTSWIGLASNLVAGATNYRYVGPRGPAAGFYRVVRQN